MAESMVKNRIELAEYFNELGFKTGAEIGVAGGSFSKTLCQKIPGLKLYCIDVWEHILDDPYSPSERMMRKIRRVIKVRLKGYNVVLIKDRSLGAVKKFKDESLDFVYIDANHTFDYVIQDIIQWSAKVKKGGIVSGHDYHSPRRFGVIEAVNAYIKAHKLNLKVILHDHHAPQFNRKQGWWFFKE